MHRRLPAVIIFLFAFALPVAEARDWFVNPLIGSDDHDGSESGPLATAQKAVDRADAGDRVVLLPAEAVYRQSLDLTKAKIGLVVEGNGVTLSGADPLDQITWETIGDGLRQTTLPVPPLGRQLLVFQGRGVRGGQLASAGGDSPPASALQDGQFHWDPIDEKSGRLTVKGPVNQLAWGVRENGIVTSGQIRNIKIFNLSTTHFLNDGIHIDGDARGIQFFGIRSHGNYQNGFSVSGSGECWVSGGQFTGNESGVADSNEADSYYTDCVMGENTAHDIRFEGGRHSLIRCRIVPGATSVPLSLSQGTAGDNAQRIVPASLVMQQTAIAPVSGRPLLIEIGPGSQLYHDKVTGEALAAFEVSIHPTALITESLYHTYPIGRNSAGTPIMAWAGAATRNLPSEAYRIIHFGKNVPQEVAPKLSPDNDWLGLLAPLDTVNFPPKGPAFLPQNSSAHAIWRWIGITAPDAVFVPDTPEGRALGKALQEAPPAGVGMVNVFINRETGDDIQESIVLPNSENDGAIAKVEMQGRVGRSPREVVQELSEHYGNEFSGSYIEALALIAKEKSGVTNRGAELARLHLEKSPALPKNGGEIAGTLLYADIAEPWAEKRVLDVAAMAFDAKGNPLEAMPTHSEMSDAVFMACPILVKAGVATGEKRYFDQCYRHFDYIAALCRRPDGLYRHSPLSEAAWGRGNGFPALGLALVLPDFPMEHEGYPALLKAFQDHLAALARHQSGNGMWHQIIDHPDSYAELTATCMIACAIAIGLEKGWLEKSEWESRLGLAWSAVKMHLSTDGETLINVCTGTGKQASLEDYYRREAILGPDSRGGAMLLMLAAEMKKRYTQ
jgi:unsaturated rhamnogalacturonyl hydrolase